MNNKLIAVTGVLGSGKTTIAKIIAKRLNYEFIEESWEENPYLKDFYKGKNQLLTEQWFIQKDYERYIQALQTLKSGKGVVVDKPLYLNHVYINMSPISQKDRDICHRLIDDNIKKHKEPDLLVHIDAKPDVILKRVEKRGREMEGGLDIDWFKKCTKLFKQEKARCKHLLNLHFDTNIFDFSDNFNEALKSLENEIESILGIKMDPQYNLLTIDDIYGK